MNITDLSPREIEVSIHIANGLLPADIAEILIISRKTVEKFRDNVSWKLKQEGKISGVVGITLFAVSQGIVSREFRPMDQNGTYI